MLRDPSFLNLLLLNTVKSRIIFLDKVGMHIVTDYTEASLQARRIELKFLLANSTHLTKQADSFVISALKHAFLK